MNFQVNDKVVCVNDSNLLPGWNKKLVKGSVYTIRALAGHCKQGVLVTGIEHPTIITLRCNDCGAVFKGNPCFDVSRFRKLTDIQAENKQLISIKYDPRRS